MASESDLFDQRLIGPRRTTFVCADCGQIRQRLSSEILVIMLPTLRCEQCDGRASSLLRTNKMAMFQEEFISLTGTNGRWKEV